MWSKKSCISVCFCFNGASIFFFFFYSSARNSRWSVVSFPGRTFGFSSAGNDEHKWWRQEPITRADIAALDLAVVNSALGTDCSLRPCSHQAIVVSHIHTHIALKWINLNTPVCFCLVGLRCPNFSKYPQHHFHLHSLFFSTLALLIFFTFSQTNSTVGVIIKVIVK